MTHDFAVLLPEKVVVTYPVARLPSRALAQVIDLLVLAFSSWILSSVISMLSIVLPGFGRILLMWLFTFGFIVYFSAFEAGWNGLTPGKKAMGIRVRMADGTPITPKAAVYRNLLRWADFLPALYLVGVAAMFTNARAQRIGDLAADTVVIHDRRPVPKFVPAPHAFGVHPFEAHVGDLRGMTLSEYLMLKRLCDRFPQLGQRVQEDKLREVWSPFAEKYEVRPLPGVHPVYLIEAVVMSYGRSHNLL